MRTTPGVVQRCLALLGAVILLPLWASTTAQASPTETEPNGDPSTATVIEVGLQHSLSATLDVPHDRDHYTVSLDVPGDYVIQVFDTSISLGPTHVTVIDPTYGYQYGFQGGNHTVAAQGVVRANAPGPHTFIVHLATTTEWPSDRTGSYKVRVLPSFDLPGAAWDAQGEPDGIYDLTREIPVGTWVPGEIQAVPPGILELAPDVDHLRFATEPNAIYTVHVRAAKDKEVYIPGGPVGGQWWRGRAGSGWLRGIDGVTASFRVSGGDHGPYEVCVETRGETCSAGVVRLAGADRYETAARVSATFPPGVPVAFVAAGSTFPDALAGSALAARMGGPVLLLPPNGIPASVVQEIKRLKPRKFVVLGGEPTISPQTVEELVGLLPLVYSDSITRIAGRDRYETAAKIARQFPHSLEVAYVATGLDFPDALAGAALAGATGGPIILTRPDSLSPEVAQELYRLAPKRIVILGGEGQVSERLASELRTYARANTEDEVTRIAGANRYETSALIAAEFPAPTAEAYVATGTRFPDALAGAARAAWGGGPMLLVPEKTVPAAVGAELTRLAPEVIRVLGGTGAVSSEVERGLVRFIR